MVSSAPTKPLRIAISGGGLAGATLANALQKHPNVTVNMYESASEFSERGAAVGIAINGQTALAEIGPETRDTLTKAGAVAMNSTRSILGSGKDAGKVLFEVAGEQMGLVVHRAKFLQELLKPIPRESMHVNKKLVSILDPASNAEDGIELLFSDGTVETADLLVGADGIHGYTRKYILGEEHPATEARYAGFWDCRALVPMETAKKHLGEEYFKEHRQYGWVGDGSFLMHDVLDNGKTVQCVAAVFDEKKERPEDEWKKTIDRKKLEEVYATWMEGPIAKGMIELLLLDKAETRAYGIYHHLNAPTYFKGRVCMMGDAAHAMTPWQGSGAGVAIEDAMVLEALITSLHEPSPAQTEAALHVYDKFRRPRTQQVVSSSHGTGVLMCGRGEGVGLDPEKFLANLPGRWGFIYGLDLKEHKNQAVAALNELLNSENDE